MVGVFTIVVGVSKNCQQFRRAFLKVDWMVFRAHKNTRNV